MESLIRKLLREELVEGSVKKDEKVDIYRDNDYVVVRPLTARASCKYGAFTKWCTSAPGSGAWESNPNVVKIIIIQRNYSINPSREELIGDYLTYKEMEESGEMTPEMKNKIEKLFDKYDHHIFEDLSKIALIFGDNNTEIWDSNNINLNDNYPYGWVDLPISNNVKNAIQKYVNSL